MSDGIREQYERFPYPPVFRFALPGPDEGIPLRLETGTERVFGRARAHAGCRVLVVGGGTLEPLVAAQAQPLAREIVAIDVSEASLRRLRHRIRFARLAGRRLAPIRLAHADLESWRPESRGTGPAPDAAFDLILASNVLHHLKDPAAALLRLAGWLRPNGLLRLVTYPRASRVFLREAGEWLRIRGVTPSRRDLRRAARAAIAELPEDHPARGAFETHAERGTATGIVDAFLNARENPLTPLEWRAAAAAAGLELGAESQDPASRSELLRALLPRTSSLDPWERLQILDDLLELCSNPVLWLRKRDPSEPAPPTGGPAATLGSATPPLEARDPRARVLTPAVHADKLVPELEAALIGRERSLAFILPSRIRFELGSNLRRAERLLKSAGSGLAEAYQSLDEHIGLRARPGRGRRAADEPEILAGHSILEYPWQELLQAHEPWSAAEWAELDARTGSRLRIASAAEEIPGASLPEQARWLQARYGSRMGYLGPYSLRRRD